MTWDEKARVFHYPCPCGDRFEISRAQLANYEDIATCPSCSLIIRVIYDPVRTSRTGLMTHVLGYLDDRELTDIIDYYCSWITKTIKRRKRMMTEKRPPLTRANPRRRTTMRNPLPLLPPRLMLNSQPLSPNSILGMERRHLMIWACRMCQKYQ